MKYLGIDLSTTKTGIVVLNENKELIHFELLEFRKFSDENLIHNINLIKDTFEKWNNENVIVGIELANFKNAMLTSRFNLYAGAIIATLTETKQIKLFNANAWYHFIGNLKDERDDRKQNSLNRAKNILGLIANDWNDDLADAFNIAWFLNDINSTQKISENVKIAKKQKQNEMRLKLVREQKKNTILKKINELDSIKNKRAIETLKKRLEKL